MKSIVSVKGLTKVLKVHIREKEGLLGSFCSLFNRKYKLITAVDDISFDIKQGEIRALVGPNGAGKSTTIKILSGILYPTKGEISVLGYIPWEEREEYVKNIGVLFGQKGQLTWELPAIDSYLLHKEIYKIPYHQFKKNLTYLIDLFDMGDLVNKPIRCLSLGEKMKCEFVCTLLHEPKLVFLDEPTIGMDALSKDVVREYIKKVNNSIGTTFILTSHDLNEISYLCDNITILNQGKIVFDDSIEILRSYYSTNKIIELKFDRELSEKDILTFNIGMTGPLSGVLEISNQQDKLQSEVCKIVTSLPITDLNIYENSIESIIKSIYRQEKIS